MCRRLPSVTVDFRRPKVIRQPQDVQHEGTDNDAPPLLTHFVELQLTVRRLRKSEKPIGTAFAPRFPKIKDESWWCVIGDRATGELLVLKRVSIPDNVKRSVKLKFFKEASTNTEHIELFLVSDCYLGLDHEYSLFA